MDKARIRRVSRTPEIGQVAANRRDHANREENETWSELLEKRSAAMAVLQNGAVAVALRQMLSEEIRPSIRNGHL